MEIRKLTTPEERFEAGKISTICFHVRIKPEELEARRGEYGKAASDDWGAFNDRGEPVAHMMNHRFDVRFDGHTVSAGGVGAVSTLPEYRDMGAVRALFGEMLPDTRRRGDVISLLYPFSHAFYRKFGYETIPLSFEYDIPARAFAGFRHDGWVKMWHPGESVELFTPVYRAFAEKYNLSRVRDDGYMAEEHVRGLYYSDRRFCYLIGDSDGPCAYVIFDDIRQDPQARMEVRDLAFVGRRGFSSMLGFLSRFTADYANIVMSLPGDVDLLKFLRDPYDVKKTAKCGLMARVVDAPRLLALMAKPEGAAFTVGVSDPIITENTGVWRVSGEKTDRTDAAPDIEVSERALIQLAVGATDLDEASLRPDVEIRGNVPTLRRVFTRKPLFLADHF